MLPGVYETKKKDGTTYYRASLTFKNKHISLGSSLDQNVAHQMYVEGQRMASDGNITISNFTAYLTHLSFE